MPEETRLARDLHTCVSWYDCHQERIHLPRAARNFQGKFRFLALRSRVSVVLCQNHRHRRLQHSRDVSVPVTVRAWQEAIAPYLALEGVSVYTADSLQGWEKDYIWFDNRFVQRWSQLLLPRRQPTPLRLDHASQEGPDHSCGPVNRLSTPECCKPHSSSESPCR